MGNSRWLWRHARRGFGHDGREAASRTAATLAAAGLLLGMSFPAEAATGPAQRRTNAEPVIATTDGPVRGVGEQGLSVFRGIPYAAAPTGEQRFKAPAPPTPWSAPLDASRFGPACIQTPDEHEMAKGTPTSEDCLKLNAWTPSTSGRKPVIVFIHGGGFVSGSARDPWYEGASLARRGAVVVTIQYRVGPFGWLDLSSLGGDYAQSMNNGLLDQMAALRWVRANATALGGDGRNVTIVGESAGAISISALLGTPSADGLYDRAVLQSGTAGTIATRDWSQKVASSFTRLAGVSHPRELLELSSDKLQASAKKLYDSQFSDTAFHPVVDGTLIPQLPMQRIASPDGPTKPVIIGTNLDEARYWLYYVPEMDRLPERYFRPWLKSLVGDRYQEVFDAYQRERPDLDDAQTGMALAGDVGFRMPAIRMAEALSRRGVPVHMYLATVTSPDLDGQLGSPHAVELPFLFGTLTGDRARTMVGTDPANTTLSTTMQQLWTSFATDGTPRAPGLTWPRFDTDQRPTLILDRQVKIENDPYPQARKTWGPVRFDGSDPGLERLTPLQYKGTNPNDPLVIAAVIGWQWVTAGIVAVTALLGAAGYLTVRLFRRRRARPREAR